MLFPSLLALLHLKIPNCEIGKEKKIKPTSKIPNHLGKKENS
jgi:hypothetical protein